MFPRSSINLKEDLHPSAQMTNLVRCTCRSHCLTFNPATQSYEGEGGLVSKSTAANHRQDDFQFRTLDTFTESVATQVLNYSPPAGFHNQDTPPPGSHDQLSLDSLYFVLEMEVASRCGWAPINHSLVFATASPTLQYQHPSIPQLPTPNREPYALDPMNPMNSPYLENESRLCEILVTLERRPVSDVRDRLISRVHEGILAMEHHKEKEWNRQRAGLIARSHGYSVVDTGVSVSGFHEMPLLTDLDKSPTSAARCLKIRLFPRVS